MIKESAKITIDFNIDEANHTGNKEINLEGTRDGMLYALLKALLMFCDRCDVSIEEIFVQMNTMAEVKE